MHVTVTSWNICDGFTNPEVDQNALVGRILSTQPDIAVLSQARAEAQELPDSTKNRFEQAGFTVYSTNNGDTDGRDDRHGLVVLARPELVISKTDVRLSERSAILLQLPNYTRFLGAHFVDRTVTGPNLTNISGEGQRIAQAADAVRFLGSRGILAGDLNAMHREGLTPGLLRSATFFANLLPAQDPHPDVKTPRLKRVGSLARRLASMASGTTIETLEAAGFVDADPTQQPTMEKGPIAVQLDHIFVRRVGIVSPTRILPHNGLSEHNLISATLRI